ncbi:MAG: hypothetical protein O6940_08250 [Ignavibacteria bacterium]|nr:hypothetical protein [Ignavibacteria bacterium]
MLFRKKTIIKKPLFRKIVNAFIYFSIGVIVAFLVLFGISQTFTFRDWLREKVVTTLNGSINGEISIERLDGTIFTSIILTNTSLIQGGDTLLFAEKIEVRTSPLRLLIKSIYIREFGITNAKISILKDDAGKLNISKLVIPSSEPTTEDSASTEFTFKFQVEDFSLNNVDLSFQTYDNKNSTQFYDNLNTDDLRLTELNLSLSVFADIAAELVTLNINNFSVKPNINGFNLKNLSGYLTIENEKLTINAFRINTDRSNLLLNATVNKFPLLGNEKIKIEETPFVLDLTADGFEFDDLTSFVPATELLQGTINTNVSVKGTLNDLHLNNLYLAFNNTRMNLSGHVKNITAGEKMLIDLNFSDTKFHSADPDKLLRTIDLSVYGKYGLLRFDTLYFKGNPLQFTAGLNVVTDRGEFDGLVSLDLASEEMKYDIIMNTQNLDLFPVINISTNLNSNIVLKGEGTSPDRMKTSLMVNANWSEIQGNKYQKIKINISAFDANVNYDIIFKSDTTSGKITGQIDFANIDNPIYSMDASLNNINLSELISSDKLVSNININISAEGSSFDPDSLELFAVISVDSTKIGGINVNNLQSIIDIRKDHEEGRVINLVSNLVDITFTGNFSILDIVSLIDAEVNMITNFINYNIDKINPSNSYSLDEKVYSFNLPGRMLDIDYSIEFKDFELLSLLLGNIDLEIDGDINGIIKRNGDSLSVSVAMDVNYFKYLKADELYFVSDMVMNTEILNDFSVDFPEAIQLSINLSVNKLFLNEKFHDINLNANIDHNNLSVRFSGRLEDYLAARLNGYIALGGNVINIVLDSLLVKYNDFNLWNKYKIDIDYYNDTFSFNKFIMTHYPGDIELDGSFSLNSDQRLTLRINNLPGKDISTQIFQLPAETGFESSINFTAFLQGTAQSPILNMNFSVDSSRIKNIRIGTLFSTGNYNNGELSFEINFLDTLFNLKKPKLKVVGLLPIDLSIQYDVQSIKEKEKKDSDVLIALEANDFDLRTIASLIPFVKELQGSLVAKVNIAGTMNDLDFTGGATLNNLSFISLQNNLKYEAYAKVNLDNEFLNFESFFLKNSKDTKNGGVLSGSGKIAHHNFDYGDYNFQANGKLKILGKETRVVNPTIFGDLTIATGENLSFIKNNNENTLTADLIISSGAEITILPARSAFSNTTDKYIYEYKKYTIADDGEALIDSLIFFSHLISRQKEIKPSSPAKLDLKVKIGVEDEAKIVFILSPEFKQNLTAYIGGNFEYNFVNNKTVVTGELVLLDGSKLEFIKPFTASGTVKFFNELDNPYLDVTATYQGYYTSSDTTRVANTEKEVEIRIRLEGPLNELNRSFIQEENNINVYIRDNNLADYQLDATKTSSDAIMFIIVGKFTDDATSQDRNVAASTAASFAGSLIGSFLNENFGDIIRSVRVQQIGSQTKFSLIGKAGPVRYEIGGTSQVFQDFSRANIKIEYPPISSLRNLVLRLQRRDQVQNSTTYTEMINEVSVKYRFEF